MLRTFLIGTTLEPGPAQQLKISYDSRTQRLNLTLSHAICSASPSIHPKVLASVEVQLSKLKAAKKIQAFRIYNDRIKKVWSLIGSPTFVWKDREFVIDIAQAFPLFYGVAVQPPKGVDAIASISFRNPTKFAADWNEAWIYPFVLLKLTELGIEEPVNRGQLTALLNRAQSGEAIVNHQLYEAYNPKSAEGKDFGLFRVPNSNDIFFGASSAAAIAELGLDGVVSKVRSEVSKVSLSTGVSFQLFENHLLRECTRMINGPEAIGLDMPINILVAVDQAAAEAQAAKAAGQAPAAAPPNSATPGAAAAPQQGAPQQAGAQGENKGGSSTAAPVLPNSTTATNGVQKTEETLHSGNITKNAGPYFFPGNVHITGSIESGAQITSMGDMKVSGHIEGAMVRCGGNLMVEGGVIMGDKGFISVRKKFVAQFLETANISCKGSVLIGRSILNSTLNIGENLTVSATDGQVAGGAIYCRGLFRTANLGMKLGRKTILILGGDWQAENKLFLAQKRLEKVNKRLEQVRGELREAVSKAKTTKDPKDEELKLVFQKVLQKGRAVVDKLSQRLTNIKASYRYHESSRAMITGRLDPNCDITICGRIVPIDQPKSFIQIILGEKSVPKIIGAA